MVATRRHPAGDFSDPTTTTPTASPSKLAKPTSTSSYTHRAPYPVTLWLLISLPLVLWDTLYVFLRPHSMPGGRLHSPLWTPYALYGTVDHVYGWPAWRERSGFTAAQASLNVVETVMYGWYAWVLWKSGRRGSSRGRVTGSEGSGGGGGGGGIGWFVGWSEEGRRKVVQGSGVGLAVLLAFAGAVMTVSKTVLYWLHEYYSGFANIGHNDIVTLAMYWVVPNGAWLVLPSYMVYVLGKEILDVLDGKDGKRR